MNEDVNALGQSVTELQALPSIVAWGKVEYGSGPNHQLVAGYNVSTLNASTQTISFTNALASTDYIVMTSLNAIPVPSPADPYVSADQMTASGFHYRVSPPNANFSFVVIR